MISSLILGMMNDEQAKSLKLQNHCNIVGVVFWDLVSARHREIFALDYDSPVV